MADETYFFYKILRLIDKSTVVQTQVNSCTFIFVVINCVEI